MHCFSSRVTSWLTWTLRGWGICLAPSHRRLRDPAIASWMADTATTALPRSRRRTVVADNPWGSSPPDRKEVLHHRGRSDHRSLPCPRLTDAHDPVFQDTRPEPFPDQAEDARVADPVGQETEEPFLAHRVEERPDVGVQDVAHLGAGDPDRERIERVVRPAPGTEAIREPEEVLLVDRVQHRRRGPLDDLVLQRRDGQRALAAIRLGDEPAAGGQRPVRSPVDPLVQALDPAIEVCFVGLPCQPVHAGGGLPPEGEEGRPEQVGGDMVEERGEPFLLSLSCNVPYAVQPL